MKQNTVIEMNWTKEKKIKGDQEKLNPMELLSWKSYATLFYASMRLIVINFSYSYHLEKLMWLQRRKIWLYIGNLYDNCMT